MAMTRMINDFKPVWIGRSDGELQIKTKKHGREFNGPTDSQLDKNTNEDDYFELLPPDDRDAIYWKACLGESLHDEMNLMKGPGDVAWVLADFPENYRLYRHVQKKKEKGKDRKGEQSSALKSDGTKANKANKGQDCYLYGYPFGRKQRFRSPTEFFPHLWWLSQGKSDDHTDCCCKHCCPEWFEKHIATLQPLPGRQRVGDPPPSKIRAKVTVKQPSVVVNQQNLAKNPQVVIQQRLAPQDIKASNKPTPKKATAPPAPKAAPNPNTPINRGNVPGVLMPTPLAAAKSLEQEIDAQVGKFIYRPGELTWFNRGTAWGLSVITKRDLFKDQRNQDCPRYLVQPLSHPFSHPGAKIVSSEQDLRPWLAWSAPGPTHQALTLQNLHYNTVEWKAVLEGRYGIGDVEVDGSIYAAKMIDDSFSLIDQLSNNTTTTGERSYNGLYLGGEKLWVGEPVRLRVPNTQQDIMIIHHIIEKLKANSTNAASATIIVVGDIYRWASIPYITGQEPAENPNLPIRLRQDLNYRNRLTIASKRTISYWKIIGAAARISITDIKGRWYESYILLPILHGVANFQQEVQRGEIGDVGSWINGRGDATGAPTKTGTRYKDRSETFGRSVPAGTQISQGLDNPVQQKINVQAVAPANLAAQAPVQQAHAGQDQGPQPQGTNDGDLSQFMDLDYAE
jgi:hypothetical protein